MSPSKQISANAKPECKSAEKQTNEPHDEKISLKDPALAAFLAWLVPGLGHLYQGRTAKGLLFLVCIMGIFLYGLYLGSGPEVGCGRVVYFSWKPQDKRLYYFCQIGVGLPAMPALVQAVRVRNGQPPLGKFMAPPATTGGTGRMIFDPRAGLGDSDSPRMTQSELIRHLGPYFELGTIYTSIAGLLNMMVIFDALCGPFVVPRKEEDESEEKSSEKSTVAKA